MFFRRHELDGAETRYVASSPLGRLKEDTDIDAGDIGLVMTSLPVGDAKPTPIQRDALLTALDEMVLEVRKSLGADESVGFPRGTVVDICDEERRVLATCVLVRESEMFVETLCFGGSGKIVRESVPRSRWIRKNEAADGIGLPALAEVLLSNGGWCANDVSIMVASLVSQERIDRVATRRWGGSFTPSAVDELLVSAAKLSLISGALMNAYCPFRSFASVALARITDKDELMNIFQIATSSDIRLAAAARLKSLNDSPSAPSP